MHDLRKFLRLLAPGAACLTLLLGYTIATGDLEHLMALGTADGVNVATGAMAAVASLLIASGGLGLLLSAVHHLIYNCGGYSIVSRLQGSDVRYAKTLRHMVRSDISSPDASSPPLHLFKDPSMQTEWTPSEMKRASFIGGGAAVTALWYSHVGKCTELEAATSRTEALFDTVHSAGTTFVAAVVAVFLWLLVRQDPWSSEDTVVAIIGGGNSGAAISQRKRGGTDLPHRRRQYSKPCGPHDPLRKTGQE